MGADNTADQENVQVCLDRSCSKNVLSIFLLFRVSCVWHWVTPVLRIVKNRVFLRRKHGRASRAGVLRLPSATPHGTLLYISDRFSYP